MTRYPADHPSDLAGEFTRFPEKILNGMFEDQLPGVTGDLIWEVDQKLDEFSILDFAIHGLRKDHTIREDKNNRYKPGQSLSLRVWSGLPYRSKQIELAPPVICTSVQDINIYPEDGNVFVDGWVLMQYQLEELANKDGFESVKDFFKWFREPFEGKLIHWTDKRY